MLSLLTLILAPIRFRGDDTKGLAIPILASHEEINGAYIAITGLQLNFTREI
jgi:hypothetical protein